MCSHELRLTVEFRGQVKTVVLGPTVTHDGRLDEARYHIDRMMLRAWFEVEASLTGGA